MHDFFSIVVPVVAIVFGISMAMVRIVSQARLEELARKERIAAIERGIDPEKLPALPASDGYGLGSSRIRRAHGLLIGGLVLLAIGLGMAVVFAFIEPEKSHWVAGVVPGFVGIALLLASRIVWPKEDARPAGRAGETRY
jgi:hypothetical protein